MEPVRKILIIRFSSIGDIVLTTPIIRSLKKQIPGVELHYLVKKQYESTLSCNPYIDKIHTFNHSIKEIISGLKKENFDFIADLQKNRRSMSVKIRLRRPSGTFNKLNKKKWLLTNFKVNLLPEVHIVDRYFQALSKINIKNDGQGLDYFIPESDKININEFLPEAFHKGYIALVTGSKQNTKKIPLEKIIEIGKSVKKPIMLLGGKEDRGNAKQACEALNDNTFNACGTISLNQSASLVEQADCVITTDTGLMHIAAAFRKKIISVWGNTVPHFGMYPYFPKGEENFYIIEVAGLKCRPCSKLGYKKCPKKHFRCMMDIDVQKISQIANS